MAEANDYMLKADRDLLAARNGKWRESWGKTRRRGLLRFVLIRYALIWGGAQVGIEIMLDFDLIRGGRAYYVYWNGVIALLMGTLLGIWVWQSNEKRYRLG
jgi:hypothetical protein